MQKTNLWDFQNNTTKSLKVEQYIQSEFGELNPQKIKCRKSSATITDISIKFENTQNKLLIEISHKGKTYTSKNKLTKENVEYLCGLTNVKKFNIDEIIGSKIKFSKINNNSLTIKENYYRYEINGILMTIFYFITFIYLLHFTYEIYLLEILITLTFSIIVGYLPHKSQQKESENIFEFNQ